MSNQNKNIVNAKDVVASKSLKPDEVHKINDINNSLDVEGSKIDGDAKSATPTTSRKRIESMSTDEIIEQNLKDLLERKSREERRANGRLVAVIVAFLVIFLAVYHAWIRKTAVLAGVLVPAAIMLGYAGWVIILAKRDKQKRALFEKHVEEVALKNKAELEEKLKQAKKQKHTNKDGQARKDSDKPSATATAMASAMVMAAMTAATSTKTTLHFENEIAASPKPQEATKTSNTVGEVNVAGGGGGVAASGGVGSVSGGVGSGSATSSGNRTHRKQRKKHKRRDLDDNNSSSSSSGASNSSGSGSGSSGLSSATNNHKSHATKDLRVKRPSIRQKLFKQNANTSLLAQPKVPAELNLLQQNQQNQQKQTKRKMLPRMSSMP